MRHKYKSSITLLLSILFLQLTLDAINSTTTRKQSLKARSRRLYQIIAERSNYGFSVSHMPWSQKWLLVTHRGSIRLRFLFFLKKLLSILFISDTVRYILIGHSYEI